MHFGSSKKKFSPVGIAISLHEIHRMLRDVTVRVTGTFC
jgi:hypothetical protein